MKKCNLAVLCSILLASGIFAQNEPSVRYEGTAKQRRIMEVFNMLGSVPYMKCRHDKGFIIGTIIKRDFEDDEITIASIVVKDAKDERHVLNINKDQVVLLGHYTNSILAELLKKGNKIQFWKSTCDGGGSGLFPYAERIKVL